MNILFLQIFAKNILGSPRRQQLFESFLEAEA